MKTKPSSTKVVQALFSAREAAAIAKCSDQTIKRFIRLGKLKAFQPTGKRGTILIAQGNLIEWLTSRSYGDK